MRLPSSTRTNITYCFISFFYCFTLAILIHQAYSIIKIEMRILCDIKQERVDAISMTTFPAKALSRILLLLQPKPLVKKAGKDFL